jgi:hypothetical protein
VRSRSSVESVEVGGVATADSHPVRVESSRPAECYFGDHIFAEGAASRRVLPVAGAQSANTWLHQFFDRTASPCAAEIDCGLGSSECSSQRRPAFRKADSPSKVTATTHRSSGHSGNTRNSHFKCPHRNAGINSTANSLNSAESISCYVIALCCWRLAESHR